MQWTIRPARPEDETRLARLYDEFHSFHVDAVPEALRRPDGSTDELFHEAFGSILANSAAALLVVQCNDDVVGMVEVYCKSTEPSPFVVPRTYGFIQSLLVSQQYRRHGLGLELVQEAHTWAARQGATDMELSVWEFEAGPLRFYESIGYSTRKRTLACRL